MSYMFGYLESHPRNAVSLRIDVGPLVTALELRRKFGKLRSSRGQPLRTELQAAVITVFRKMKMPKAELIISASQTRASIADQIERTQHALNVRDLMAILQVSDQTIYRMIADQTIPFLTVRNSYRFDPKQIAEWLRQRSMRA
jgi:excisionase family DNA binding protein